MNNAHITTEFSEIVRYLKITPTSKRQFSEAAEKAYALATSRVQVGMVCQQHPVERGEFPVARIGGVEFRNPALHYNFADAGDCFVYLLTLGSSFGMKPDDPSDYLLEYYVDQIGNCLLRNLRTQLAAHLKQEYDVSNLSRMSPGSTDVWPLSESEKLFAVLGEEVDEIGVSLSESHLMIPFKTVSGILFQKEERYVDCLLCQQTDCEARQAEYNSQIAEFYRRHAQK